MKITYSFSGKVLLILVLSVLSDFACAQDADGSLVKMVDVLESTIMARLEAAGQVYPRVNKLAIPIVIDGKFYDLIDVPDCKLSDVLEITYKPIFGNTDLDEEEIKLMALYGTRVLIYGVIIIRTRLNKE